MPNIDEIHCEDCRSHSSKLDIEPKDDDDDEGSEER